MEKKRHYLKLRVALMENGMTIADLAERLGMDKCSLGNRFNGRAPWKLSEVYDTLEILDLPIELAADYFRLEDLHSNLKPETPTNRVKTLLMLIDHYKNELSNLQREEDVAK